jgi:glycosyltransferase involved in cell wall biosynthesis
VENLPVPFDRRVWLEAKTLAEAGWKVSVICPKGQKRYSESYEQLEGIDIYRFGLPATSTGVFSYIREYAVAFAQTLRLVAKVMRRGGFDVIHATNPPDLYFVIGLLLKPFGKRFVFDQHDLSPETFVVQFEGRPKPLVFGIYWLLRLLERLTFATANAVVVTNESVKDIAIRRGHVSPDRAFIVRSGPDHDRLYQVPADASLRSGKEHLVCYVGVMGLQDGVDYLLRAVDWMVNTQQRDDFRVAVIGDGDHAPILKNLVRELGLEETVTFTGRISDEDLRKHLSTASVCVSPDPENGLNEHHTMNKVLEYMAMGKPQVAFDLTETRRSADGAALYATPNNHEEMGEKILQLLDDPELRKQLGAIGRERIEASLGWEHTRTELVRAYEFLATGERSEAATDGSHTAEEPSGG